MIKRKNSGVRLALCMLSIGVTLGYVLAKLVDRLDGHFFCLSGGSRRDLFDSCCHTDDWFDDCPEDSNQAEPYIEPLQDDETDTDEP